MMPMLVKACPSFEEKWEEHKREFYDEENFLLYPALGKLARHIFDLYREGKTSEFEGVFEVVERLHTEAEPYVKEAATIGLLESLQNITGNNNVDAELFYKFLKPESAKWWNQLNKFWKGEIRYVGETLNAN